MQHQSYPPQKTGHDYTQQSSDLYMMQPQDPGLGSSTGNLVAESTQETYTALYVMSILASIFCTWLPCSFIGLMHVIAARADASRGSNNLARKKKCQALCWTAWACGLGGVFVVLIIIAISVALSLAGSASGVVNMYDSRWN